MKNIVIVAILALTFVACQPKKEEQKEPAKFRPRTSLSSKWVSKVVDFRPAPGQFINTSTSNLDAARGIIGKKGMVSLGAYGGYIDFMFDHSVMNQDGVDFVIHGNAFSGSGEPGIVMVAYDANENGKPDIDEWYELKGSEYDKSVKGYQITYTRPTDTEKATDVAWRDNQSATGAIHANQFHKQCYFPLFLTDDPKELVFNGSLLPQNGTESGGIWTQKAFEWGYVDCASEDYAQVSDEDNDTKNSNKFDIANAVDKDGKAIVLEGIDFIRVYNGVNQECGWLGETSTEVCGAISLTKITK